METSEGSRGSWARQRTFGDHVTLDLQLLGHGQLVEDLVLLGINVERCHWRRICWAFLNDGAIAIRRLGHGAEKEGAVGVTAHLHGATDRRDSATTRACEHGNACVR